MALPREMELLDLDQFEVNKSLKSPARKFAKKKHGGKKNGVDGGEHPDPTPNWETYSLPHHGGVEEKEKLENVRGFLLKKRKWPLKGFHKRFFVLEEGILSYGRSLTHMQKGKVHGRLVMAMAVISVNQTMKHINIDGGEHSVYHLKAQSLSQLEAWLSHLQQHRLYMQTQLSGSDLDPGLIASMATPHKAAKDGGRPEFMKDRTELLAKMKEDLALVHQNLDAIQMYVMDNAPAVDTPAENGSTTVQLDTPKKKKFGGKVRKKASASQAELKHTLETSEMPPDQLHHAHSMSNISTDRSSVDSTMLKSSFVATATSVHHELAELLKQMEEEQKQFKETFEKEYQLRVHYQVVTANLQAYVTKLLAQNTELKDRLSKIQVLCSFMGGPKDSRSLGMTPGHPGPEYQSSSTPLNGRMSVSQARRNSSMRSGSIRNVHRVDSFLSVAGSSWSGTEFYDAQEELVLSNVPSSDNSDEEMEYFTEDDDSEEEADTVSSEPVTPTVAAPGFPPKLEKVGHRRRTQLPSPRLETGPGLLSLLRKHIGKDLSRVSMPVTMNEPLSALQRLCEELQYAELLNEANELEDPYDRMVRVAAFAVSAYSGTQYRAGNKPFNPLLGETYECVREDKGFKFVAEQVSHHPPIAACHAESDNFVFWQDAQLKSKYWGRSFEVIPVGTVNLILPKHGDHYKWDKVTTCVYNIMSGERSVDHYGTMKIVNKDTCYCKLTFYKTASWTSKKHYIRGCVYDADGHEMRTIYGHWQTSLYCGEGEELGREQCIWTTAPMPEHYEDFYGFTQFAVELNEIEPWSKDSLPRTDCRFRPDQRLLEEGKVEDAQNEKERVEQLQRDAREERQARGEEWMPRFFSKQKVQGQECWLYKGNYWTTRENPGFAAAAATLELPVLW